MNKRGDGEGFELGWQFVFSIVFVAAILAVMLVFIGGQTKNMLVHRQVIAKEVCLIATSAKAGSTLAIEHAKGLIVESKDYGFAVKNSNYDPGYIYPCYSRNASSVNRENQTSIKID